MLNALKFVKGAVAKKDFAPELTHFSIRNGLIKGFNGNIALCSPIPSNLDVTPSAATFMKVINSCESAVQMSVTATGRLSVKSGGFKAFVDCIPNESFPDIEPSGTSVSVPVDFMEAIETLAPFIGEDASRLWARGVMFRGSSAFATNNVILVQYWLGVPFPIDVNIPQEAIKELLRIGETPIEIRISDKTISFIYSGDRWLCSTLYSMKWPDVLSMFNNPGNPQSWPEGFWEALEKLSVFTDKIEAIYFLENEMTTTLQEGEGASVDVTGLPVGGRYSAGKIGLLEGVAETIDLSFYPKACPFFGKNLRGLLIGMQPHVGS